MMSSPYMKKQGNPADVYLTKEIMEATPQKLMLKVYDFSIQQALQKNMIKTNRGIQVLIESLNFEVADARGIAIELLKLYQYCQDQARKGNFEMVHKILSDLRESWIRMFREKGLV